MRLGILAALIALLLPQIVTATGLARLSDREDLLGWEAVGRLDINGSGYCTGTLIAPDLVLTAAHCVYDRRHELLSPDQLLFRAGLQNGGTIAERQITRIVAMPDYRPGGGMTSDNIRNDVALLQLAEPISTTDADPFILHTGPASADISVTSYGEGRSDAPSRQRHCRVVGEQGDLIAFDCNVTFGSSGAPVFVQVGGRGRIFSIVSGGTTDGGQKIGFGMKLPAAVAELKAQLRQPARARNTTAPKRLQIGNRSAGGAKFVRH
ncbi:MAG: serine protease [Paracoccaceae bacterium]